MLKFDVIKNIYNCGYLAASCFIRVLTFLVMIISNVYAEEANKRIDITSPEYLVKYILFLVLVILFCLACLWLIKKFRISSVGNDSLIKIITSYHLSPKEKLFILEVGGEYLLISSANSNIQFLYKIDNLAVEKVTASKELVPENFMSYLKKYMLAQKESA